MLCYKQQHIFQFISHFRRYNRVQCLRGEYSWRTCGQEHVFLLSTQTWRQHVQQEAKPGGQSSQPHAKTTETRSGKMDSFYAVDASLSVLQPTTRRQRRGWIKHLYGGPNEVLLGSVVVTKLRSGATIMAACLTLKSELRRHWQMCERQRLIHHRRLLQATTTAEAAGAEASPPPPPPGSRSPARSVQAWEELAAVLLSIRELTSARQQSALGVKPSYITVISIIPGRLACSSHYLQNHWAPATWDLHHPAETHTHTHTQNFKLGCWFVQQFSLLVLVRQLFNFFSVNKSVKKPKSNKDHNPGPNWHRHDKSKLWKLGLKVAN